MAFATALGTGAGLVQLAAFVLYIRSLRRGRARPNGMSWLMWAYGSLVPFYIASDTGAPAPVLLVPVLCALLSMWVAFRAFVGGPSVPAARHDWLVLAVDVAILGGYLAHLSGRLPGEGVDTCVPALAGGELGAELLAGCCARPASTHRTSNRSRGSSGRSPTG